MKYVLVAWHDENLDITHVGTYDTLEEAQKVMREEWGNEEADELEGDSISDYEAYCVGGNGRISGYINQWKIIEV